MKTVNKLVLKKNFWGSIIFGIFLIALGVFVAGVINRDFFKFLTAREYVFTVPCDELEEETFYDVSNELLYDWYAEDDEGRYYITASTDSEGDTKYLGYYVFTKDCEKADDIVESTWDSIENNTQALLYIKGKGFVYDMTSTEKNYFDEMCEAYGIDRNMRLYSTIVLTPMSRAAKTVSFLPLIAGIALAVYGIVLIVRFLFGGYKKKLKKCMTEYSISEDALEGDVSNGETVSGAVIGRNYLLSPSGCFTFSLLNLVWCYKKTTKTRHMLYGIIPTGTTKSYSVIFVLNDGKIYEHLGRFEKKCDELIETVSKRAPHAIYGYTEELANEVKSDFSRVVQAVEERKITF